LFIEEIKTRLADNSSFLQELKQNMWRLIRMQNN
jgi:hypothetical protein